MSALEDELARQLDEAGIRYEREYRAIPDRRYRWDFLIPMANTRSILVEVQGYTWHKGGHTTHAGLERDYSKHNLIQDKYPVYYFNDTMIHDGTALETIRKAVEG